jgi:prevent-host-death family protein
MDVAQAKEQLGELVGQVASGKTTVLILRRGKPLAKLVPPDAPEGPLHLGDVKGWLEDDDPFFAAIDDIVAARVKHIPRILERPNRPAKARARK